LRARKATVPTWVELRGVSGTVGTSITRDCNGAAVPPSVVQSLIKVFARDVSFRKLRRGDRFRVLYEVHVDSAGEIVRNGRILAAEVVTRGKPHFAVYFQDEDGKGGYYDAAGVARAGGGKSVNGFYPPVRDALLTSGFSRSRRHPVHGRVRPHHGVDFAAPHGTPVRAIADGRVTYAHWHGQLGRAIRIDHGGSPTYASIYGHLSRIDEDAQRGAWVRKGDVIGYVGRTGSATGPHLHLSVRRDGKYVDPLPVLRFAKPTVTRATGAAFEAEKKSLLRELASLDVDGPVRLTRLAMRK
jgi:murein DD-endopeptidase MepM/ murein hydrolase activator NlpD